MSTFPLGRLEPTDFTHVEKYPLSALEAEAQPRHAPVVLGVNWYEAFDRPERDSRGGYWIGRGELGRVRGGHAVALLPAKTQDPVGWWDFYNQGSEGACVGFASSRMMSLLNRRRYEARWLYRESQKIDEWPGEAYEGTSVRAAMDVLRARGHREVTRGGKVANVNTGDGILENRWARSADEVLRALGVEGRDHVIVLNSWGRNYPHFTRMPAEVLERLIRENGEAALVTDRA